MSQRFDNQNGALHMQLYQDTEESREGVNALKDKRKPDFRKYAQ